MFMVVGEENSSREIMLDGGQLAQASQFKYLGNMMDDAV